jgi:hypothetical protein
MHHWREGVFRWLYTRRIHRGVDRPGAPGSFLVGQHFVV